MDVGSLIPTDIRESGKNVRWSTYDHEEERPIRGGLLIQWETEDIDSDSIESHEQLFTSWDELRTTYRLFDYYAAISNNPYHNSYRQSGSVMLSVWGEDPTRAEPLGDVGGFCCDIVATDSGYVGLSDNNEPGYGPGLFGSVSGYMISSSDGLYWSEIESPPGHEIQSTPIGRPGVWRPSVRYIVC